MFRGFSFRCAVVLGPYLLFLFPFNAELVQVFRRPCTAQFVVLLRKEEDKEIVIIPFHFVENPTVLPEPAKNLFRATTVDALDASGKRFVGPGITLTFFRMPESMP